MWDTKFAGNGPFEVCRNNKWKLRHTTEAKFFALAKGQPYLLCLNDRGPGQLRRASHAVYAVIKCGWYFASSETSSATVISCFLIVMCQKKDLAPLVPPLCMLIVNQSGWVWNFQCGRRCGKSPWSLGQPDASHFHIFTKWDLMGWWRIV